MKPIIPSLALLALFSAPNLASAYSLYGFVGNDPNGWWDGFGTDKGRKPVTGGDKSLDCEGFTKNSCPKDVKSALDEARKARNIARAKALQRLYKTMRRLSGWMFFFEFFMEELNQPGICPGGPMRMA
jgi:hypothetical protein